MAEWSYADVYNIWRTIQFGKQPMAGMGHLGVYCSRTANPRGARRRDVAREESSAAAEDCEDESRDWCEVMQSGRGGPRAYGTSLSGA